MQSTWCFIFLYFLCENVVIKNIDGYTKVWFFFLVLRFYKKKWFLKANVRYEIKIMVGACAWITGRVNMYAIIWDVFILYFWNRKCFKWVANCILSQRFNYLFAIEIWNGFIIKDNVNYCQYMKIGFTKVITAKKEKTNRVNVLIMFGLTFDYKWDQNRNLKPASRKLLVYSK